MPELPWQGYFIAVDAAGAPTWIRCVICHRRLTLPASIERGCGDICLEQTGDLALDQAREQARKDDRHLWRLEGDLQLPAWRYGEPVKTRKSLARVAARKEAEAVRRAKLKRPGAGVGPALTALYEADPTAYDRWLIFEEAKKRRAS